MSKANKNGLSMETEVYNLLKKYKDLRITREYPIQDIFGKSKVDFKLEYCGKIFILECKNQVVPGSVDQKLPYYIENIRENKYGGHFVFIFNGNGIRNGALEYLKRKQKELDFSIIKFDNLENGIQELLIGKKQTIVSKVSPVVKWAGGKRSIMNKIIDFFPNKINGDYHEPFCGGLSVLCELYNTGKLSDTTKVYLNDNIYQLMYLYEVIKEYPESLVNELSKECYTVSKENFEKNKKRYNILRPQDSKLEIASLFLFLNKTGFNGVYRENKKGEYNVPFGKKDKGVTIYNTDNLYAMHTLLQKCILTYGDYSEAIKNVKSRDLVYFDPPYYKTFSSYSSNTFDKENHITLSEKCYFLKTIGATIILSNSSEEFIKDLYKDSVIHEVPVKRVINSKASDRKNEVCELCIQI